MRLGWRTSIQTREWTQWGVEPLILPCKGSCWSRQLILAHNMRQRIDRTNNVAPAFKLGLEPKTAFLTKHVILSSILKWGIQESNLRQQAYEACGGNQHHYPRQSSYTTLENKRLGSESNAHRHLSARSCFQGRYNLPIVDTLAIIVLLNFYQTVLLLPYVSLRPQLGVFLIHKPHHYLVILLYATIQLFSSLHETLS